MIKKKWMSSLLAAALAFTTVFGAGVTVKAADETDADQTGKITVYVAAEGADDEGHTVDIGKIAVQVDKGTKGDVAVEQALQKAGYTDYLIEDTGYGANLNKIGDIANAADWSKYWGFYINGAYAPASLGNTTLQDNDKISYLYTYYGDTAVQAKVFDDDASLNPDSDKTASLLANAKAQQEVLADTIFKKVFGDGQTVYGIETPDALYVAFSLLRADYKSDYFDEMYANVESQLKSLADTGSVTVEGEAKDEAVIAGKYPELTYAKIVLFVTAMGKDARNVGGYNLIEKMAQKSTYEASSEAYMLDSTMLLALDSGNYFPPAGDDYITKDDLVNNIAAKMDDSIAQALQWSSVDSVAMALQPLYKYATDDILPEDASSDRTAVQEAYAKGIHFLESTQNADGSWSGYGTETNNVWTLAQIMTAMGQLRINPCSETDGTDFIKNGMTVLDDAAVFVDVENKKVDDDLMSYQPEQLLRGLTAVIRAMEGRDSLYDVRYSGVTPEPSPSVTPSVVPSEAPSAAPSQSPTVSPSNVPSETSSAAPSQSPAVSPSNVPSQTPAASAPAKTATPAATASAAPAKSKVKVTKVKAVKTKVTVKKGKKAVVKWNVTTAKKASAASVAKLVKVSVNKKNVKVVKKSAKTKKAKVTQITVTVKGVKKGNAVVTLKADKKKSKVKVVVR
ncbi:putative surface/cell-adhesion protein [Roseburia sp. CAG:380]|jgi:hypothetical protein|uniref:DUF4430 domain-containing protein n=1 Tax=Roseburia sp. AM59-24XD TaxID=2293138 RepID=UPI00033CAACC|nr:DUF4430 domain-containing protein [Roseburia sp. AM59-24XD]RHP86298.1 DUF4430 domain-containing protein [Roseburia sp. AM59-24XD]CDC95148.1 putative surface/cell-adhesion protein [Roseburia sp. CAG:380]